MARIADIQRRRFYCSAVFVFVIAVPVKEGALLRHYSCDAQTSYQCGVQLGRQAKREIGAFVSSGGLLSALLEWTESNRTGQAALARLEILNRDAYPHLIEEVQGLAAGAGVAYKVLLVANLQYELYALAHPHLHMLSWEAHSAKGCTDWHSPTAFAWAHNEDNDSLDNKTWYFVTQRIVEPHSDFAAFTYAGQLAGWAYGFNAHGIAQSINALRPQDVRLGLAVQFTARDSLDAVSLDDAISRATRQGQASGQHFNFGSTHQPGRQVSVETSPTGSSILDPVFDGFVHANLYIRLNGTVPQPGPEAGKVYQSSLHRVARLRSLAVPVTQDDLILGISDRSDERFPVYRRPMTRWDYDLTESSVIFDAKEGTVSIWDGRPSKMRPAVVLHWDDPASWRSVFQPDTSEELIHYV